MGTNLYTFVKRSVLMAGLAFFSGCSLMNNAVPANRIQMVTPWGRYDINTPKNVNIQKFQAAVDTNGVVKVTFEKWVATNDPAVIDKAGAARVAEINAWNTLINDTVRTALSAAVGGP